MSRPRRQAGKRKTRRRRNRKQPGRWVTYSRCFLLTMGALFVGLVILVFYAQGHERVDWPSWAYLVLGAIGAFGVAMLAVGLLDSRKAAEEWADSSSNHEASIVVMILAAPLYWLLKAFERNRD